MEIEQEARDQGWKPQEDYKGDPSKWVDAETFVERGKQILPMLQNTNKRLLAEQDKLRTTVESLKLTVANQSQSMEELKKFHEESSRLQVEKARKDLLAELKEAKAEGNVEQEIQLTSDLSRFDAAQQAAQRTSADKSTQPVTPVQPVQPEIEPYVQEWMNSNPWYGKDVERTDMMDAVAMRLKRERVPLTETAFLNEAARIVNEKFDSSSSPRANKVEGSGRGEAQTVQSTSYAHLPADAKAQCEKQASLFVGPDRAYKTKKEWQDFYATEYHKIN